MHGKSDDFILRVTAKEINLKKTTVSRRTPSAHVVVNITRLVYFEVFGCGAWAFAVGK